MSGPTARPAQRRAPGSPDVVVCPCGPPSCGVVSLKGLSRKSGHVPNCGLERYGAVRICHSCQGRRVRKSGKAGNRRAHLRLGGGPRTVDDDLFYAYSINVTIESKTGAQVEGSFTKFIRGEKARHWFAQAERKVPVGADAMPALYLELAPSESYLVVKVPGKGLR